MIIIFSPEFPLYLILTQWLFLSMMFNCIAYMSTPISGRNSTIESCVLYWYRLKSCNLRILLDVYRISTFSRLYDMAYAFKIQTYFSGN